MERWAVAPADETTFHALGELSGLCPERARRPSARPLSAREGPRDSAHGAEGRPHMQPPPAERHEMCGWRSCKVAPDHHVTVDYMRYSVPFRLIGEQVDVRLTDTAVTVMAGGEAVAERGRLRGRRGQYSTVAEHMPPAHAAMDSPWSPERFSSWAHRTGAETGAAVDRLLASRPVVERAFVPAGNMLGLSKSYSPELLERACARSNALGAVPSYTALKNAMLAIRAADAEARASGRPPEAGGGPVDRAKSAGRLRGADAYRGGRRPRMLTEGHFDMLTRFRVRATGDKLREMAEDDSHDRYGFEERMETLIGAEASARRDRKVAKLVREARFKPPSACVEDVVYLRGRRLGRDRVARLASCGWVEGREVVVIVSKTGCGKSFISQALGNAARRGLFTVRYARLADIMDDLNRCRAAGDGSYYERMDACKRVQLLIVDDFPTTPIATRGAIDLFEIMEAREGRAATLIASQLEPNEWYLRIEGELMAGSTLNRVATGARHIDLDGPSMREYFAEKRDS